MGRPRAYDDPHVFDAMCEAYFAECDARIVNNKKKPAPYLVLGLSQFLGITRQTLMDYGRQEGYSDIVRRAKDRIALDLTMRSIENKDERGGCLFNLRCNHEHVEVKQVDHTSSDGTMTPATGEAVLDALKRKHESKS